MSDILDKLKTSGSATKPVELRGQKLAIRILTEQDYQLSGMAAHEKFKEEGISLTNADLHEAEVANQLLCRALVEPSTNKPVFPDVATFAEIVTREEKSILLENYLEYERDVSPRRMTEAEFDELLAEVKKKPSTARLNNSSFDTLRRLIVSLAGQLSN